MKMVKSLLLGSAAGLVAVAGAQAADLPVKAKPVEYVKVCSLYGAGYYYLPGTDVCISLGGYVREEWAYGFGGSISTGPWNTASSSNTRQPVGGTTGGADTVWRTRAYVNVESRQQTAYGTLRTYLNIGTSGNNSTDFNANRAFIQIAGFTVGRATSYFDFYSGAAVAYLVDLSSDSGDAGLEVFAYTAQLGNGVSASLSVENQNSRGYPVYRGDPLAKAGAGESFTTNQAKKIIMPDIVGNLRIDQAWGSAQVMAGLHDASGTYYGSTAGTGHPDEKLGWAVGAGIKINMPMVAAGDYFAAQVAYSEGALKYICNHPGCGYDNNYEGGTSFGYGLWTDSVYSGAFGSEIQLTTAWGVAAAWEHFWTPSLRTSVHGGYLKVSYNDEANAILCNSSTVNFFALGASGVCDNDFSRWQIGSRTQWNVTKQFYMGFDVLYQKIETASKGAVASIGSNQAQPAGLRTIEDQDNVAVRARWHRDLP